MMGHLRQLLTWLRLTDEDGLLSITHAAVYVAFACVLLGRQVSWTEWGLFVSALGSYRVKRYLEGDRGDSETVARLGQAVTALQADVRKLQTPERLAGLRDGLRQK